jgi:hypothetical protein
MCSKVILNMASPHSKKARRYVEFLAEKSRLRSIENVGTEELMEDLRGFFEKKNRIIEYDISGLAGCKVSRRSPLEFRESSVIHSDGTVYLSFDALGKPHSGGFKYLHPPLGYAITGDASLYLFYAKDKGSFRDSSYECLFVPEELILSL